MLSTAGPRAIVLGFWFLAGIFALTQRVIDRSLLGAADGSRMLRQDLWLLALWALVVPAILWSVRRFPLRGGAALRHATLHCALATAFVVASNVLVRLPLLLAPSSASVAAVARDTLLGLARFYPMAMIVYGVIVALGHRAWGAPREQQQPPADPIVPAASEPAPEEPLAAPPAAALPERVIVREWNRVHLVRPDDIEWIESDDNYVVVHVGDRTYKGRGRIRDLETQLDASAFARIHRSAIVRVASIREVQPLNKGDLAVILHSGKTLRVARGRRAALESVLGVPL